MDEELQWLFLTQIYSQCEFFFIAVKQTDLAFNTINQALTGPNVLPNTSGVFAGIQASLTAVANISKALWGQRGTYAAQRKILRDRIGVSDDSPLRLAKMRDHFDHFDERLQRWWDGNSQPRSFMDLTIMSHGAVKAPTLQRDDKFRVLEPMSMTVTFWGDEVSLRDVNQEIIRIYPKVTAECERPYVRTKPREGAASDTPPDAATGE